MRDPRLACGTDMSPILGHPFRIRSKWNSRVEVGIRTGVDWTYSAIALNTCSRELPRKACLAFAAHVCRFLTRNFFPETTLWLVAKAES